MWSRGFLAFLMKNLKKFTGPGKERQNSPSQNTGESFGNSGCRENKSRPMAGGFEGVTDRPVGGRGETNPSFFRTEGGEKEGSGAESGPALVGGRKEPLSPREETKGQGAKGQRGRPRRPLCPGRRCSIPMGAFCGVPGAR